MPIYVYKCDFCDHVSEEIRKASDVDTEKQCMKCANGILKKLISTFGVTYKCPGFHKTDYNKEGGWTQIG